MIIVKIQGGLGNQMFQYAVGRHLALKNNTDLKLDISYYNQVFKNDTPRQYSLKYFNIIENIVKTKDIKKIKITNIHNQNIFLKIRRKILKFIEEKKPIYKRTYINEPYFNFCPEVLKIKNKKNIYLYGNWQTEKYFKEIEKIIKKDFTLKNNLQSKTKNLLIKIKNTESVSIHIRRGDYINNEKTKEYHGTCSLEYYFSAIKKINKRVNNPHFFIFSDDIEWVKKNLQIKNPITFVSKNGLKDYEELILMSRCNNNIIANSSFSWWGAWLNNNSNKIVIAPKKWFNDSSINIQTLYPNKWIKI